MASETMDYEETFLSFFRGMMKTLKGKIYVTVKAGGQVVDCINTLKKDNTGYHLKNLFIGSEGTLGIVTEVGNQCPGPPKSQSVSMSFLGDGNLHLNICSPQFNTELLDEIEPFVFEWISERGGSISAEHGIGFKKTKFLKYSKSAKSNTAIDTMRQIKQLMDPKGILNPYKVLLLQ